MKVICTIFSLEAIRVKVFNYFIERNEKYTEIRVEEENDIETPELDWEKPDNNNTNK
ncbi:MAG: hypothetical protein R6U59_08545 [Eubacteriales bacterium]